MTRVFFMEILVSYRRSSGCAPAVSESTASREAKPMTESEARGWPTSRRCGPACATVSTPSVLHGSLRIRSFGRPSARHLIQVNQSKGPTIRRRRPTRERL